MRKLIKIVYFFPRVSFLSPSLPFYHFKEAVERVKGGRKEKGNVYKSKICKLLWRNKTMYFKPTNENYLIFVCDFLFQYSDVFQLLLVWMSANYNHIKYLMSDLFFCWVVY